MAWQRVGGLTKSSPDNTAEIADLRAELAECRALIASLQQAGRDGATGADEIRAFVTEEVTKQVAAIPEPKDGVGLTGALIDRDGHLVVTLSDGTAKNVGSVMGRDADMEAVNRHVDGVLASWPRPKDGKDGLGFDDAVAEYDGERTVVFKLVSGDRVKEFGRIVIPTQIYRGIYEVGKTYERGDVSTWGGSMWHANTTTTAKPGESKDWVQCVMRGKPGERGQKGEKGDQGERGLQGPQGVRY